MHIDYASIDYKSSEGVFEEGIALDNLGGILVLLGVFAFCGGIVWLIIALIRRKPRRIPLLTILAGPILFVVGGVLITAFGSTPSTATSANRTAEPTAVLSPTPTPIPSGKTRSEPIPYGYSTIHSGIEIAVLDVTRGANLSDSLFASLDEGHEWVIVKLRVANPGSPDKTQRYNTLDFRIVGKKGVVYDDWFTPDTDTSLGSGEFFGGGEVVGDIVQQVDEDDSELVLIYSPSLRGSRYLSLEKPESE